ncbi:MAG: glycosyl hydrolase [Verrucomicrobia bacterium]|nr:glycosyl hydrolase [Verrucomicrobiota bacterium]
MDTQISAYLRSSAMQLLARFGRLTLLLALACLVLTGSGLPAAEVDLGEGFRSPPESARAWVYWFWLDGNITKEGITADLEAMQRVGLGGALWMWGGGVGEGVKGPVKFLDPQWWDLMRHTVREADRLGLKINLTAGSGWSHSGGPWIKPEHSMQRLELAQEIPLKGPGLRDVTIAGSNALVAVLAYPASEGKDTMRRAGVKVVPSSTAPDYPVAYALDQDPATRWISKGIKAGDGPTEAHPVWLTFEFPNPYAAAAFYLAPFQHCGPRQCQMQVSKDGQEFQTICRFELAADTPRTITFEAPASRYYRLLITSAYPFGDQDSWNTQIAEVQLLQSGEQPFEKELYESRSLVDLTSKLNSSGHLSWEVPPGAWTLQVFRHRSTGDQPHPILPDEGGLECDKLSPEAVDAHWNGYIRRVLDECGPAARRVIRWVHADSFEFAPQTWTPKFQEEFKRRCGYDPVPYLPVILGKVVDSPAVSARFLWDYRRVRADLFAEGIGGHLRELCRREEMALTTEPHLVPEVFDQIQYGGHVSEPVGNFLGERNTAWYAANPPVGPEVHLAEGEASAAYTYGLNGVVWAEAFTGVDHAHAWKETPEYLKTWGDLWFTEGINRFAFHCWAHSPSLTRKPGITLGPWGIHFDRRNTWFDLATGYLSYLSRCQFLLQQGLPAMDVCMLTGDGVVAEFPRHPELRAAGYDYHGLTTDVLPASKGAGRLDRPAIGHAVSAPGHL